MTLNKKVQYAMLLCLYLSRAGRSSIEQVACTLRLSPSFLSQVAHTLGKAGVIISVRGPGGGYQVKGDPTVGDVFKAVEPIDLVPPKELSGHRTASSDRRAFAAVLTDLRSALNPVLNKRVSVVGTELALNEVSMMSALNDKATVN